MVGVQDKNSVQCANQYRIWLVFFTWRCKHHVHKVCRVREVVLRIIERQAVGVAVTHRRNSRDFGNQAVNGDFAVIGNFQAVLIEGGQSANHTNHHCHRMRIAAEAAEEPCQLFMYHSVVHDCINKLFLLLSIRQFAINQKVTGLQIITLFGKLLNRIPAIIEIAFIAVDKGNL